MKKVVTVSGIRPDFIRMSEVFNKLDKSFEHILIHSGQHYDHNLSDVFFKDLKIRDPDFNLHIGAQGLKHYQQQGLLANALIDTCAKIKPDCIIFLGDSNTVLSAIPLKKEGYKIAHIEAGMRSYDDRMLEEINRKACDHVSDFLFVYHEHYKQKALKENIDESKIFVVGNTIIEPLLKIADLSYSPESSHILLDIHRPENFKYPDRLRNIIKFASKYGKIYNKPIKMLNFSRTIEAISIFKIKLARNIEVIPLMGYKDFIKFQQESLFIVSDSGTAQEEPILLKKNVIVPRDFTERPESLYYNNSFMLNVNNGHDSEIVFQSSFDWLNNNLVYAGKSTWLGDGTTSDKIVNTLRDRL